MLKYLALSFTFIASNTIALEMGSESFVEFADGAAPHSVAIDMARSPSISNNLAFSDRSFIKDLRHSTPPYGSGQKYAYANMMNLSSNFNMAAAKTDPRNTGFIMNSMERLLSDSDAEMELDENLSQGQLDVAQAGDSARRYIGAQLIKPNVGYYQSADNQQAFDSAYDNVLLGRAEEKLFEDDRNSAVSYFNEKSAEYKNSDHKQAVAGNYQRDGLMRSKKTAEKFRDFFAIKGQASMNNLAKMPTRESLVGNCHRNTPGGENLFGTYHASIPADEMNFYQFEQPVYDFDFCDQYVINNESFLIQNQPVHGTLEHIIDDSQKMVSGLDEISKKLSDQSLSSAQIVDILKNNEAWKSLQEKDKAWMECKKTDCLARYEKAVSDMAAYPGHENFLDGDTKNLRLNLKSIRESGKLSGNLGAAADQFKNLAASSSAGLKGAELKEKIKNLKALKAKTYGTNKLNKLAGFKDEKGKKSLKSFLAGAGSESRSPASVRGNGSYHRGEDGVLRGPSGKPIHGYESPAKKNLFEIISRRYMIKLNSKLP